MIKKVFKHLGTNWIKYGFGTVAIIVGILGAVTLDNWNSRRLEEQDEIEYLSNLKVDLESQLENDLLRFVFHNRLVFRGRLSGIHVYLFEDLAEESKLLIEQMEDQLALKK